MMRRVRVLSLALALACAGGEPASAGKESAQPNPPPAKAASAPARPAPPAGTAYFDADAVAPYFEGDSPAGKAAAAFAIEDWKTAQAGFTAALAAADAPRSGAERARLVYLLAKCDAELENWAAAAAGFDAAAPELPLLADYLAYDAARAWFFAKDLDKADARAAQVSKGARTEADARLLRADILRTRGDWKAVAAAYEAYLKDFPKGPRLDAARFHLAEAYEQTKRAIPEALTLYRQVTIEAPLSSLAEPAQARVDALVATLPKKKRAKWTTLTAAEHMAKGKELFDAMRNPESEAEYHAALSAPGLDDTLRCQARYYEAQSVFKRRERTRSAAVFELAIEDCKKIDDADIQMKAAYTAGRAYSYSPDEASQRNSIAKFEQAEKWHPEHSFADDARMRQAEGWAKLPASAENDAKVTELLSSIPTLYPQGDMRGEALWRLAWRAYKKDQCKETIAWLEQAIASVPHDYNWWGEGQAYYWRARCFVKLGDEKAALESYTTGIKTYPLSYYSLLGLNRLREKWPKQFATLTKELQQLPAGWSKDTPAFSFKPRAEFATPGFARALELVKLGLGDDAQGELARLGMKGPSDRKQVTDPDQVELLWATALLYDRAHNYDKSHWIARWSVLDYKDAWPTAANRARWQIAYPKAWWHILDAAAKEQGYPTQYFIAFVREESAFTPTLESWANAIGLTQMIHSTATRFGKGLGFEINRENLRDPVKNVAVGSRFLAFLWKTFDHRVALITPSYNAGEGATWRWLCDRGDWPADEFAEAIPHDEARNYSKRVINSYFVYSYLEDGTIPEMPFDIPASAINQKKCKK